jgi:hypothetical protein
VIAWVSSSTAKCATPDLELCVTAPPSSSMVTSSWVTVLMTSGPVRNMNEVSFTITMKSVSAGEYTAPPAQGPRMTLSCGMTPEASVLAQKMSA